MDGADEPDSIAILRLALDEGRRGIDYQVSTLDTLHSRAGLMLAAASAATAFFGGAAVDAEATGSRLFVLACLAYGLAGVCCLWVVIPRSGWWDFTNSSKVIAGYAGTYTEAQALRALANEMQTTYDDHEKRLKELGRGLLGASGLVVIEVLCWAWLLTRFS